MTPDDIKQLIQLGREGRNLEFKRSTSWSESQFKAKIVKSVLAFSNVRDGGILVLGVEQQGDVFQAVGVESDHLDTYDQDQVASYVAEFADPYSVVHVEKVEVDGKWFVIVRVDEFDQIPVICKQDGACNLRRGAIYTRTYRMPESAEVPGQAELREILDMAVEKGIRKFQETLARTGLAGPKPQAEEDDKRFHAQLGDLP